MTGTDDGLEASTEQRIDRFLDDQLVEHDGPGASLAVFDADGILYATGFGTRNLDDTAPATANTLYTAASVTKTVTAVAVLQLVEGGELALDEEIREHVSVLDDVPGDPITVRELLTHNSGMPSDTPRPETLATKRDVQLHTDGAADRRVTDDPPYMYYNSGYNVLGEIVATVDGRSYVDYVTEEVLAPLGMTGSTFDPTAIQETEDAMTGYVTEGDELVAYDGLDELLDVDRPAGGLVSPMPDLARLWQCLLAGGALDGERILDREWVGAMTSRQTPMWTDIDGGETAYGYGLVLEDFLGETLLGHDGALRSVTTYVGALAEREVGVALAVNSQFPVPPVAKGVIAIAAGEDPNRVVRELALWAKLDAVTGTYEGYREVEPATVEREGGHLSITLGEESDGFPAFPENLSPEDYSFYEVDEAGRRFAVEFRRTDEGMMLLYGRDRRDRT